MGMQGRPLWSPAVRLQTGTGAHKGRPYKEEPFYVSDTRTKQAIDGY